jgi:hypothetical protein
MLPMGHLDTPNGRVFLSEFIAKLGSVHRAREGVLSVRSKLTRLIIAAGAVVTVVTVGGAGWKF